jgi:DNA-binding XRE family transcriptional regulator
MATQIELLSAGPAVKALRAEKGWSQEKLARETELSKQTIIDIEMDRKNPSWKSTQRLAGAFGLTPAEFMDRCAREDSNPQPAGYQAAA